ncbi:hypothetical protein DL240_04295 [Lujinxingia litoralis]|uniref:JAB domain-containing protein n=1 Tax=Lujinxingia litoralis TaxID=2211119 RepID=A0A328C9X4_9DELT|nr:Mov34/MPN/PAD-1 family protein [Lujinxingia litoralis]RAL25437.1 hypothetical protein DL240_04295 [Lujinxingia litoralis]
MSASLHRVDERWTPALLAELSTWVSAAYPEEGCGLVLQSEDGSWRFHPCENVADRYHALDPEMYPRTARDFYMIDPMEFVRVDERGEHLAAIVHSHPDVGDYFSAEDVAAATFPRDSEEEALEPIYPDTDYLVVSVRKGQADGATLFRFLEEQGGFEGVRRFEAPELHRGEAALKGSAEAVS